MDNKLAFKSWFCVWNNPQEQIEGDPPKVAETILEMWISDKPTRVGAVAYCISADGLHHVHMVLEDSNKARFSALKKAFPKAHLEPTRGTKEEAEDYINKRGKYEDKGEKVVYIARYGDIKANRGQRKDFEVIEHLIEKGHTPQEIMAMNFSYRRYDKMIKQAYFYKRMKETPFIREVKCVWHVGESGSGKSYTAMKLVQQYGEDSLYLLSDYDHGGLDNYNGERILFMDEFRGQIRFTTLLSMLQGYKQQFHARFHNIWGLWEEVHITSVLPPDMIYQRMVDEHRELDTMKQLFRRIDTIVYHYLDGEEYKEFSLPMEEYANYKQLKALALGKSYTDGFIYVQEKIPFN